MYVIMLSNNLTGVSQVKTLNWYVTRGFIGAFLMSIAVLSFGMTGARLVEVLKVVSQGIPFTVFLEFILCVMPVVFTFTVPWAVLVAVMLVFGRLSADSEITAMRACGISLLQIMSPIMLITMLLSGVCLYLQLEIGYPLLGKTRDMMKERIGENPMAMFEPGKQLSMGNFLIYVDDKDGADWLRGVEVYVLSKNNEAEQNISAESGKLSYDKEHEILTITLHDCLVTNNKNRAKIDKTSVRNADNGGKKQNMNVDRFFAKELNIRIESGSEANKKRISNRPKYMRFSELMGRIRLTKELGKDTTELEIELNQRIAFALSPIAFLLLGLPLAIRTSRRETSVGLFLSVILAGVFYLSIMLIQCLESYPKLYPQYLLWLPNIVFQTIGAIMTYRVSQK